MQILIDLVFYLRLWLLLADLEVACFRSTSLETVLLVIIYPLVFICLVHTFQEKRESICGQVDVVILEGLRDIRVLVGDTDGVGLSRGLRLVSFL
jgi:hypothetical protein